MAVVAVAMVHCVCGDGLGVRCQCRGRGSQLPTQVGCLCVIVVSERGGFLCGDNFQWLRKLLTKQINAGAAIGDARGQGPCPHWFDVLNSPSMKCHTLTHSSLNWRARFKARTNPSNVIY